MTEVITLKGFIERRKATRIPLSVPARYRFEDESPRWNPARTVDFSQLGVRLVTSDLIAIGRSVEVEMELPDVSGPFCVRGRVVWNRPSSSSPQTECGISFINLKELTRKEKINSFLADKLCHLALRHPSDLVARPALSYADYEVAYHLVYEQYLERGYCRSNSPRQHYHYHCVFPDSRTFLLEKKEQLLGTISLIPDSPGGLPLESIFPEEIANLRKTGRRLAEVVLLAVDLSQLGARRFTLTDFFKLTCVFCLFKIVFDYSRNVGVTDLVITMHPKHEELYRYLNFETIGPIKTYSTACGKPAIPMHLDISRAERSSARNRGVGSFFLRESFSREMLEKNHVWTAQEVREMLVSKQLLWPEIPWQVRNYIAQCYSL